MLFKKRKTEEFHFTPEQEACLANCRQLTNDELRVLNGGASYKGMPSSVQMQQGLSGGSSNNDSSSSSGTSASKGHHGMPSDVEAILGRSENSSVKETEKQKTQEVQDEHVPQADTFEVQHKGVRGFFKRMFGNDGKKTVHTFGAVASATWITGSEALQ